MASLKTHHKRKARKLAPKAVPVKWSNLASSTSAEMFIKIHLANAKGEADER
jgi:hypothetical protein